MHPDILLQLAQHTTAERIAMAHRERMARSAGRAATSSARRLALALAPRPMAAGRQVGLILDQQTTPPTGE